jgi:ribosomal-protein-alanine N-acetyltransferase
VPVDDAMIVERLTSDGDLDAVVALEAASFTNPWTREMLARELEPPTAARVYLLRRRQGLGRALMEGVLADVAAEGVTRATLEVRRSNVAAQRLYARLGFEVAGQRRNYYTQPEEDALILWRTRPDPHTGGDPVSGP